MEKHEIGKLEDGRPDPCYDCANLPENDQACASCTNYNNYKCPVEALREAKTTQ